jgi:hypothetical protein
VKSSCLGQHLISVKTGTDQFESHSHRGFSGTRVRGVEDSTIVGQNQNWERKRPAKDSLLKVEGINDLGCSLPELRFWLVATTTPRGLPARGPRFAPRSDLYGSR